LLPHHFSIMLNVIFSLIVLIEVTLENHNNVAPSSYRGIFYRRYGPLNAIMEILRHLQGPNARWGTSRVVHDPEEPGWPRHHDLD
jgi:hypothetical protein